MAAKLYNLARMTTTTSGTGTITLGSAVPGFLSFVAAGIEDGDVVSYGLKEGDETEVGLGTYGESGGTLSRDGVVDSTNGGDPIELSGSGAEVYITPLAADFIVNYNDLTNKPDLKPVATSGDYGDLANKPTLGTAAATDASAYATAAQGAKADSALQSFDVAATVHAATGKSTPVDADELGLVDSAASNALKKLTWGNLKSVLKAYFGQREVLSADRTYYVDDSAGNDSNDGLATGSGRAFKTIQKAIDTACALDLSIYSVTINVADGEYSGAIVLKPYLGTGPIAIVGNTSSPQNCLLKGTGHRINAASTFATYQMRGFETQTVTSGNAIALGGIGILEIDAWRFGPCAGSHMRIDLGARLDASLNTITVAGSASYFAIAGYYAAIDFNSATVTFAANVTFTATAYAQYMALVNFQQVTFSLGAYSVTGQRYNARGNSLISSGGGGASFIPGSTSGAVASGGTYI